jgi:hypothetical protein
MIRYFNHLALKTLKTGKLRVSEIGSFNDPYEYLLNCDIHYYNEVIRDAANSSLLVLCCSDPNRIKEKGDILMWSHYSASHSGFRIHFDASFLREACIDEVEITYSDQIPKVNIFFSGTSEARQEEEKLAIEKALSNKGTFWEYEAETRYCFTKQKCHFNEAKQEKNEFYYINLPPEAVTRVDIGMNTDPSLAIKMELILDQKKYSHVEMYEAQRSQTSYSIEYKKC